MTYAQWKKEHDKTCNGGWECYCDELIDWTEDDLKDS